MPNEIEPIPALPPGLLEAAVRGTLVPFVGAGGPASQVVQTGWDLQTLLYNFLCAAAVLVTRSTLRLNT